LKNASQTRKHERKTAASHKLETLRAGNTKLFVSFVEGYLQ